jgi:hypothetical protein
LPPLITSCRSAGGTCRKGIRVNFLMLRAKGVVDPTGMKVGRHGVGDKKIMFLAETLPKLRVLWSFHLFGHHATWRVGSTWGVKRAWIGWEKFSIVFTPYSIDYVVKNVSSDSEKVLMHSTTKACMSHTCDCHLARDVHPYVRCIAPVTRNHLKLFWDA